MTPIREDDMAKTAMTPSYRPRHCVVSE